jgi:large subunit ribosomal protein L17
MKHLSKKGRKFGRVKKVRRALLKSLIVNLIKHGRILTTQAKAKELSKKIEPLITCAKRKNLAATRNLAKILPPVSLKKIMNEIAPKYQARPGGYTRIIKAKRRQHDAAEMCYIELV